MHFLETINILIKTASDKTYIRKVNLYFIRTKYGTITSMQIGNKPTRNEQKGNDGENIACLKRNNFELIRNVMHQLKSLRDYFIPQRREIDTSHYPGYVKRLQKER